MKTALSIVLFGFLFTMNAQVPAGAVGDWPFDGNAQDVSGNGNHGVVNGAIPARDRFNRPGMAYRFDGTSSEIDVPHSSSIDVPFATDFSFSYWQKTYPGNTDKVIISKHIGGSWNGFNFIANNQANSGYCTSADHMYFYMAAGFQQDACSNSPVLADSSWRFIVGIYDAANSLAYLYINGVQQTDVGQGAGTSSNTSDLNFGYEDDVSSTSHYSGVLDGARMYKRMLSQQEIASLYNECIPSVPVNTTPSQAKTICKNSSAQLKATSTGTVNWYASASSTVALASGTAFTTGTLSAGVYTFFAAGSSSCTESTRTAITVTVSACLSVSESESSAAAFEIFPNPSTGEVHIRTEAFYPETTAFIHDACGRQVYRKALESNKEVIGELPAGIYIVTLYRSGQRLSAGKLVIAR
jgi:hypothetical protein